MAATSDTAVVKFYNSRRMLAISPLAQQHLM